MHACIILMFVGIVFTYGQVQVSMWAFFHATAILIGIAFPFFYRNIKAENKIKYIHITTVVLALVLPAIPSLLHLIDGYTISSSLNVVCAGRNRSITYITVVLPNSVLCALTTAALIITFWKILKVYG